MMYYNSLGFGFLGMGLFGFVFMIALWAFFIWLIVWLVRKYTGCKEANGNDSSHDDPLLILKRRYAGGEISRKEYEEMRKNLSR